MAPLVAVGQEGKGSGPKNIWERNACLAVSAPREKELSRTSVRRVNKAHLFIPSSFVGCQCLKTGLSKTRPHLFLLVSLHFRTHARAHTPTHRGRDKEKVVQNAFGRSDATLQTRSACIRPNVRRLLVFSVRFVRRKVEMLRD